MVKLKRLLPTDKDAVHIDLPVSEEELLDRQLQYPLLKPKKLQKGIIIIYMSLFRFNGRVRNTPFKLITVIILFTNRLV